MQARGLRETSLSHGRSSTCSPGMQSLHKEGRDHDARYAHLTPSLASLHWPLFQAVPCETTASSLEAAKKKFAPVHRLLRLSSFFRFLFFSHGLLTSLCPPASCRAADTTHETESKREERQEAKTRCQLGSADTKTVEKKSSREKNASSETVADYSCAVCVFISLQCAILVVILCYFLCFLLWDAFLEHICMYSYASSIKQLSSTRLLARTGEKRKAAFATMLSRHCIDINIKKYKLVLVVWSLYRDYLIYVVKQRFKCISLEFPLNSDLDPLNQFFFFFVPRRLCLP